MSESMNADRHQCMAMVNVMAERARQVEAEGRSIAMDDELTDGQLAQGAVAYVSASPDLWPWDPAGFKPRSYRRNLVRAAALLIAEIERIDRLALVSARSGEAPHQKPTA